MEPLTVILWKLNEVMAKQRVKNRDLAKAINLHENSIYRLRAQNTMPRLSHETLDAICTYLHCQPGELLEWTVDEVENA